MSGVTWPPTDLGEELTDTSSLSHATNGKKGEDLLISDPVSTAREKTGNSCFTRLGTSLLSTCLQPQEVALFFGSLPDTIGRFVSGEVLPLRPTLHTVRACEWRCVALSSGREDCGADTEIPKTTSCFRCAVFSRSRLRARGGGGPEEERGEERERASRGSRPQPQTPPQRFATQCFLKNQTVRARGNGHDSNRSTSGAETQPTPELPLKVSAVVFSRG